MDSNEINKLCNELEGFGLGVDNWYRYFPRFVLLSDGMLFLLKKCGGKGFLDVIASHQAAMIRQGQHHQHWKFERKEGQVTISVQHWDENSTELGPDGDPVWRVMWAGKDEFSLVFDELIVHCGWAGDDPLGNWTMGICIVWSEED